MAKRNELRSLLSGLNSSNARGRKHIAFGDLISCDQIERFPLEPNLSACNGSSFTEWLRRNINHLRATVGADVRKSFHFLSFPMERSEINEPRGVTNRKAAGCLDFARHDEDTSPANRNHFAIGLVIVSKIVFPRLSFDHVEKKLPELFIARAGPQRCHDVKLQIAAETRAQLSIAGEPQLVAVLAEMHVRHCTDKTYALCAVRNLIVSGRTIRAKLRLWNQTPVCRLD